MEEMFEQTEDMAVEAPFEDGNEVEPTKGGNGMLIGIATGLAGIAGTLAWKKLSPSVKEWAHNRKIAALEKKAEKAAETQMKAQAELSKLTPEKETEEK